MLSANFKPKTTAAASRGFLATPSRIAVGADKKKKEGKEREGIAQSCKRVIFQRYGEQTTLDRFLLKLAGLKGPMT